MNQLTRQQVIDQLRVALRGELDNRQLAAWAFDQFYAIEEGGVEIEPGYRRMIGSVLDDLMFADQPGMALSSDDLTALIAQIEAATPVADEDDEDAEEEDDDDDWT
jgi:hypothetical protein